MTEKKKINSLGVTISNHIDLIIENRDLITPELLDSLRNLSNYCLDSSFTVSQKKRNTKNTLIDRLKYFVQHTIEKSLISFSEIGLIEELDFKEKKPIYPINYAKESEALIFSYNYFINEENWVIEKWNTHKNNNEIISNLKNIEKTYNKIEKLFSNPDKKINILIEELNLLYILTIDIYNYISIYNSNKNKKISSTIINVCEYCFRICNTGKTCKIHKTYNSEKMEEYLNGRNLFLESSDDFKNFHNIYKTFRELTYDNNISLMSNYGIDDDFGPEAKKIHTNEVFHRMVINIKKRIWNNDLKKIFQHDFLRLFPNIYHLIEPNFSCSVSFDHFIELSYQEKSLNNIYDTSKHPFWFLYALTIADYLENESKKIEQKKNEIAARDVRYFGKKKTMTYKQIVDSEIEEGFLFLKEGETRKGKESNIKKIIKKMHNELTSSLKL